MDLWPALLGRLSLGTPACPRLPVIRAKTQRTRRPDGCEIAIIDNCFAGAQMKSGFLNLPSPVIHISRDRYIVDAHRADKAAMYDVVIAPPVERVDRRYTLDQARYNEPLRALMPRLDLEVNFDTSFRPLTPDKVDRLSAIADAQQPCHRAQSARSLSR